MFIFDNLYLVVLRQGVPCLYVNMIRFVSLREIIKTNYGQIPK